MTTQPQPLIDILEKLLKLHQSLLEIEKEKTEVIKKNDINALNLLMKNEKTHISAIGKVDNEREKMITTLFPEQKAATLTDCLPLLQHNDPEKVENLQKRLMTILNELKDVNHLNQALLEQSLQFVNLNLDLLSPNDYPTYTKGHEEDDSLPNISLFDSKA